MLFPALILFVLGLCIGSFLNVVIFRTHDGRSIVGGRSHCPHCHITLAPRDLIPIASWILIGGRCRSCKATVSWQYPAVELVTGLLFAAAYLRYAFGLWLPETISADELWIVVARDVILIALLAVIFVYDLRYSLILDRFTIPAMIIAFVLNLWLGVPAWSLVAGGVAIGGFFALQYIISKGKWIGGGDIRMGAVMGLMLGLRDGLAALFLAYMLGAIVGVYLLARKRAGWNAQIPFGTFLAIGTLLVLFFGEPLISWYLGFFLL